MDFEFIGSKFKGETEASSPPFSEKKETALRGSANC